MIKKKKPIFKVSEKNIENAILHALSLLPGCKVWKNQSVGIFDPKKKIFRRPSKYQINGVSDILGIYKGRMICLEVKSKTGKLSPHQKAFLDEMKALGAISACVKSVDEAFHAVSSSICDRPHIPEAQLCLETFLRNKSKEPSCKPDTSLNCEPTQS